MTTTTKKPFFEPRFFDKIESTVHERMERLIARLGRAEDRADALHQAAQDYEEATPDPTPEQEAYLDRLLDVAHHASRHFEDLDWRIGKLRKILTLMEEEDALATRASKRIWTPTS